MKRWMTAALVMVLATAAALVMERATAAVRQILAVHAEAEGKQWSGRETRRYDRCFLADLGAWRTPPPDWERSER